MIRKIVSKLIYTAVVFVFFLSIPGVANALTKQDLQDILNQHPYYSADAEDATLCGKPPDNLSVPAGSKVYMVGDSITVLSTNALNAAYAAANYTVTKINADGGRAISKDTGGNDPTGLDAVATDAPIIAGSDVVVVELGTNSGTEDLNTQIPLLIQKIRDAKPNVQIYWVNLFYTKGSGPAERNAIISSLASSLGYKVIDLTHASIELEPTDGVHPTATGQPQFAQAVVNSLSASGSGGAATANSTITFGTGVWGSGSEIYKSGLNAPYDIEQWAVSVLKNIAKKSGLPESSIVTQEKTLALVAWAHAEGGSVNGNNGDFNPLNTKLNHADLNGVNQGNSSTDSNSNGYPTFDKGVEASTRAIFAKSQSRIGSTLITSTMTAESLMSAIAGDFISTTGSDSVNRLAAQYPGNLAWATLSITGYNYGGGIGNHDKYLDAMLGSVSAVRANYSKYAQKLLNGSTGTPPALIYSPTGTNLPASANGCGATAQTTTNQYVPDCTANNGNAAIACTAVNELVNIPYSLAQRAAPTDPSPQFLDCSALTGMAVYRTFGVNLNGMCSAQYKTDKVHFQEIDVHDVQAGDFVGIGSTCTGAGGNGHIGIVVSYDATSKKLVTVEASSPKYLSGLRGIGGTNTFNVGFKADGNGGYEWAVRYIGTKGTGD